MTKPVLRAAILGTGSALPEKTITNADLEKLVDTSDSWIVERTGVRERRAAAEGEGSSLYATRAAQAALAMAGVKAEEIDLIVLGTTSPDSILPATANLVQRNLGAPKAACFDVLAACSGFVYAATIAQQFIETGASRHALVIGVELLTKFTDYTDRTTCILFGDGAGAVVLGAREDGSGVLSSAIQNDGTMCDYLVVEGGGSVRPASHETVDGRMHFIKMKGNETFKIAIRNMTRSSQDVLARAGCTVEDVSLFIPHQANKRISDAVAERLGIPPEKTYSNIERVGNTSAASIPIALDEAVRAGRLKKGDLLLMTAFGGGLTWGSMLVRWGGAGA